MRFGAWVAVYCIFHPCAVPDVHLRPPAACCLYHLWLCRIAATEVISDCVTAGHRYAISRWLTPGQLCGLLDERPRACFSLRLHPLLIPLFSKSILTFPLFPHSTHTYAQTSTGIDRNVLFFNTLKFCCLNHKTLQGVQSLICGLITNHST